MRDCSTSQRTCLITIVRSPFSCPSCPFLVLAVFLTSPSRRPRLRQRQNQPHISRDLQFFLQSIASEISVLQNMTKQITNTFPIMRSSTSLRKRRGNINRLQLLTQRFLLLMRDCIRDDDFGELAVVYDVDCVAGEDAVGCYG